MEVGNGLLANYPLTSKSPFLKDNHAKDTVAGFSTIAMINASEGVYIGGTYTFAGGGAPVDITLANIVDVLWDCYKRGVAYWINNSLTTKAKPDRKKQKNVMGGFAMAQNTPIVDVTFTTILSETANTSFDNYLGANPMDDVWLFTNNTFIHIPYKLYKTVFSVTGMEMNDINTTIQTMGGFDFAYHSERGEIDLALGYGYGADNYKDAPEYSLTQGATVNLTAQPNAGKWKRYIRTVTNTQSEIPVSLANYGADFFLLDEKDYQKAGNNFTYNPATSKIIINSATPAGVYFIKIVAIGQTGCRGDIWYQITII